MRKVKEETFQKWKKDSAEIYKSQNSYAAARIVGIQKGMILGEFLAGGKKEGDYFYFGSMSPFVEYRDAFFNKIETRALEKKYAKELISQKRDKFFKSLNVGDIIYTQWGYEQTNAFFYQITKKSGKSTLFLREIEKLTKEIGELSRPGTAEPIKNKFKGDEFKKVLRDEFVNFQYGYGYLYQNKPISVSWYG
jgi:hypothetical protein